MIDEAIVGRTQHTVVELVAMIVQLLRDALQAGTSLVVVVVGNGLLGMHGYHTLALGLHLAVFALGGTELSGIVARIKTCHHLTFAHMVAFVHQHLLNGAGHLEGKVGIVAGFGRGGILHMGGTTGRHGVGYAHQLWLRVLRVLLIASQQRTGKQETGKKPETGNYDSCVHLIVFSTD